MSKVYMAVDQYGETYHGLVRPRRDLLRVLGRSHANKMYMELKESESKHIGYVIAGLWLTVYEVLPAGVNKGGTK